MRTTSKAFEEHLLQVRAAAALATAATANQRGRGKSYRKGDKVAFYIPPTAVEAAKAGRKDKHMLWWRGPTIITKVISKTTYEILYEGKSYSRCYSELRHYNSDEIPELDPIADHGVQVGTTIAFSDHDDGPTHYHLGTVRQIKDGNIVVVNSATTGSSLKSAQWRTLYDVRGELTTHPGRRSSTEVVDEIPIEYADGYIHAYNVQLNKSGTVKAASRKALARTGMQHHVIGNTF